MLHCLQYVSVFSLLIVLLGPGVVYSMSFDEARHLLARTGFGGAPADIQALASRPYEDAVASLLDTIHPEPLTPPPSWVNEPPPDLRSVRRLGESGKSQRKALRKQHRRRTRQLQAWWYTEMLTTDSPLTEQMTLFWHNHFTSSAQKVRWPVLLYRQNLLLRQYAVGNFGSLLHAIAKDPAMLVYLDNRTNRKGKPNENFARELLELFTLGEGAYSEHDIKEAARAFTGWTINRRTGGFQFRSGWHDDGIKTFLGYQGRFNGEDILNILLEQPRMAVHLTTKLWRTFISTAPEPRQVDRLAQLFRDSQYELKPLLYALLTSAAFRDPANRGTLIKSPVELIVGTVRLLHLSLSAMRPLVRAGRALGQSLFLPPNVKGWPGGTAWITSSSLLARQQFLRRVAREMDRKGHDSKHPSSDFPPDLFTRAFLPLPPVHSPSTKLDYDSRVSALLLDPVYQLK